MTSPGFWAPPSGRLSVAGTRPNTSASGANSGNTLMTPMTAAPPAMSSFMVSMERAGLRDSPPESNVMPLPMRATFFRARPLGR